jgi:NADPH2:quinone reductase
MKYIQIEQPGGPEVLKLAQGEKPQPGPGEVLIRVAAAGVNRPDLLQRQGHYPPPPGASLILGLEVAGIVEAIGEAISAQTESSPAAITTFKVGDPVCALLAGGGYSEFCVAPAAQCLPVPKGLSLIEAAGIPETFFTVWANIVMRGKLARGENFLVHGGTSGIGTTAIQLARQIGAKVFATAGTPEKCKACIDLGASLAINYKTQDYVQEIKTAADGKGVDLILDMVGGPYFEKNLESLAQNGRLVQIAFLQGNKIPLDLKTIMQKGLTLTGSTLRPRSVAQKAAIARELFENVWPWLESKQVRVLVDKTFSLADASKAHAYLEAGEHIGKIILTV